MSDIHVILAKYFAGEASTEEADIAYEFERENPKEFVALQQFWSKDDLNPQVYDSEKAWVEISRKASQRGARSLNLLTMKIAAVAAVFLFLSTTAYFYFEEGDVLIEQLASIQNESLVLPDGSLVYMNKGAQVSYPRGFAPDRREVTLHGEAFFEIKKDASRPFLIRTRHAEVEVLGTSFNVNTAMDQTSIAVVTGRVKVSSSLHQETQVLGVDQSVLVTDANFDVNLLSNENLIAWKTGVFSFEKMPLEEVIFDLNRYYGGKIKLSNSGVDCLFSSRFDNRNLDEIIEIIKLSCGLQLNHKNENYELF